MLATLRDLFANPKFLTLLIGLIVAIGSKVGLHLDNEIVGMIVGLVAITIGAQAHVMAAQISAAPPVSSQQNPIEKIASGEIQA